MKSALLNAHGLPKKMFGAIAIMIFSSLVLMPWRLSSQESWIKPIPQGPSYRPADDEVVLQTRYVTLAPFTFQESITLDLFDGTQYIAERLFVDEHIEGSRVWVGRISS
jgi:hypothetical protein